MYSDFGKMQFLDVMFDLTVNTLTKTERMFCNPAINGKYDDLFYKNVGRLIEEEFNCTVPFLPEMQSSATNGPVKICQTPDQSKAVRKRYEFLYATRNSDLNEKPCVDIDVSFGIMETDHTFTGQLKKAHLQLYLQTFIKVKMTILDYDIVTMVGEIGGYTG